LSEQKTKQKKQKFYPQNEVLLNCRNTGTYGQCDSDDWRGIGRLPSGEWVLTFPAIIGMLHVEIFPPNLREPGHHAGQLRRGITAHYHLQRK
jgi:hypothetical protein